MDIVIPSRLLSKDLITSESFDCNEAFGHGIFQRRLLIFGSLALFLMNIHGFAIPLISRDVEYWCKQPPASNVSEVAWRNLAVFVGADRTVSRCQLYKHPEDPNNTETIRCQEWVYDDPPARTTIVSEWNLVCQRRFLIAAITAVHNAGAVFFAVPAGCIADRIGRMPVLLAGVALLIVSSVAGCVSRSYVMHTTLKFFTSGSVGVVAYLTIVSLFEVTTHDNRPLHVVLCGMYGVIASDLWFVSFVPVRLSWMLKQAIFLLPTLLSLPFFCIVQESPRWLVSKGRLESAEAVMMAAAEENQFLYAHTASMVHKLKKDIDVNAKRLPAINVELLDGCSIQRRTFIMCVSYFSFMFTQFITLYTSKPQKDAWIKPVSFTVNLFSCLLMYLLVTRITMLSLMTSWFGTLGIVQCLLGVAVGAKFTIWSVVLILLSKAIFISGIVLCSAYVLELSPTAVRATVACWSYACSRLGAVAASIAFVLQGAGRLDLAYAIAAFCLFTSMIAQRRLPMATTVECAKKEVKRVSAIKQRSMEYMKNSLDSRVQDTSRSKASSDMSRSSATSRGHLQVED
ncbi:solute carrier family 22 member 7-like [Amblyomma americanum]